MWLIVGTQGLTALDTRVQRGRQAKHRRFGDTVFSGQEEEEETERN